MSETVEAKPMHIELTPCNYITHRYPCVLCGGWNQWDVVTADLIDSDGKDLGEVCPECLAAGPAGTAERIRQLAEEKRKQADALESVAADVALLSANQWLTPGALKERIRQVNKEVFGAEEVEVNTLSAVPDEAEIQF